MNDSESTAAEIENERKRQAASLAADDGEGWEKEYRPGSFGCHELLDRTAMLAGLVEEQIQSHPACVANAEWFQLAERAASALRELYQRVGAAHVKED